MPERYLPLPGFPESPLWIIITFYIIGVSLLYFGWAGRGVARVVTMTLGAVVFCYTFYPNVDTFITDHPNMRACVMAMWTSLRVSCPVPR